jgi:hypothetical protein
MSPRRWVLVVVVVVVVVVTVGTLLGLVDSSVTIPTSEISLLSGAGASVAAGYEAVKALGIQKRSCPGFVKEQFESQSLKGIEVLFW